MPKKIYRKRKPMRKFIKKRRGTQRQMSLVRGTAIAPRTITRMKYNALTSTGNILSGGTNVYQYNMNSIYDPDATSTGSQPLSRDQFAAFYNRYRVFSITYIITLPPTTNNAGSMVVVVPVNGNVSPSLDNAKELPRAQFKYLSTVNPTTFYGRVNLPSLNGATTTEYKSDDRFQALFSTNPSEVLRLLIVTYNGTSASQVYNFNAQLTYHVEMFDPIPLGQS